MLKTIFVFYFIFHLHTYTVKKKQDECRDERVDEDNKRGGK